MFSLEIVIPVLNEEKALPVCIDQLFQFCEKNMQSYDWKITIADNGSTDNTYSVAADLRKQYSKIDVSRMTKKGRGRALKLVWMESQADIVAYMDVDLSTDLAHLPSAVDSVASGECSISVGSRLSRGSKVVGRTIKREIVSRCYSALFRALFLVSFKDAQCGFKVVSRQVVDNVIPLVEDTGWFFDTELLIISEKNGYKVCEIPVIWTDDPDTRVKIFKTAWEDIKGLLRIRFGGLAASRKVLSSH